MRIIIIGETKQALSDNSRFLRFSVLLSHGQHAFIA
jgi:hypothetical protein